MRLGSGAFLGNVGKVRLIGLELEGSWRATDNLTLGFSGAYNHAEYVSYANAPAPVEYTFPGGPVTLDFSGKRLPSAPEWSGQFSANYDRPINGALAFFG